MNYEHYERKRSAQLQEDAREAFARHELRSSQPGRWLIQRRNRVNGVPQGDWCSAFATEIISLWGGELYVGGDIDFVIFARYGDSPDPGRKLRWMGKCRDVEYYVRQKAIIGTGRELVLDYDEDAARAELLSLREEWLKAEKERSEPFADNRVEALDDLLETSGLEDRHWALDQLYLISPDDAMESRDFGMVTATRVYYAHAACARLCQLLDDAGERSGVEAMKEEG